MRGTPGLVCLCWLMVTAAAAAGNLCPPPPNPNGYCALEIDRSTLAEADFDLNGFPDNVGSSGDFCSGGSPAQCTEFVAAETAFDLIVTDPARQDVTCSVAGASVWIMSDGCQGCLASGFESATLLAGTTTDTTLKVVVSDDNGDVCFCAGLLECSFSVEAECNDGADGDGDGLIDAADPDCCADDDGDGFCGDADCDDQDPNVHALPAEASNLNLAVAGGQTFIGWTGQPGAFTDIVTGFVAQLTSDGSFARALCLAEGELETSYWDSRPAPLQGSAYYYLARLENNCGPSSYGAASAGIDARDALDTASPCP